VTARDELPDEIQHLRDRYEELLRTAKECKGGMPWPPRLRDRNGFFNSLLHGEREVLERVRPIWKEHRAISRKADKAGADLHAAVHKRVVGESAYQSLVMQAGEERDVKRSCDKMLAAIRTARGHVKRVNTNQPKRSGSAVDLQAKAVTKDLRVVQQRAGELEGRLPGHTLFKPGELARLEIKFYSDADRAERGRQYEAVKTTLRSLEKTVGDLLREAKARERTIKAKQRQYLKDGQARYGRR